MKTPAAKPIRSETRCRYRTPTGRRCRSARSGPGHPLCSRHRAMEKNRPLDDLAPDLTAGVTDIRASLQSTEGVHKAIAELYILLAQDRVSPRRAAVLAYLSSLLLRTAGEVEKETESKRPVNIIWEWPRNPSEGQQGDNRNTADLKNDPGGASITTVQRS